MQSKRVFNSNSGEYPLRDGTNSVVERAKTAKFIHAGLQKEMPHIVDGATVVIGGAEIAAFDGSNGLQFWYNNASIHIYELKDLRYNGRQLFIENKDGATLSEKIFLDPSKVFI